MTKIVIYKMTAKNIVLKMIDNKCPVLLPKRVFTTQLTEMLNITNAIQIKYYIVVYAAAYSGEITAMLLLSEHGHNNKFLKM